MFGHVPRLFIFRKEENRASLPAAPRDQSVDFDSTAADASTFLIRPCSTVPGPSSVNSVTPSASMFFNGDKQTEPFKCIACGICARKCPTGALEIINVPAKA